MPVDGRPARVVFRLLPENERSERPQLLMSPAVSAFLGLADGDTVPLRLHRTAMNVKVRVTPAASGQTVLLSRHALAALRIPTGIHLRLQPAPDGTLRVGPLIGVLTPPRRARNPYLEQTSFFQRLLIYARHHHLGVYMFSPREIDWRSRTILGWDFSPQRGWVQRRYPFPHAVYDRTQLTRSVRLAQRGFERLGLPLFNSLMGSKWWQHRILRRDPYCAPHLPETRRVRSGADIAAMLARYGSVYIKSAHGGKGMGIWQVTRTADSRLLIRHTDRRCRVHTAVTRSLAPLAHAILTSRRQPYIVQQRLWLMRWQGRIFDIRVLVQKDGSGRWQVTGAGLRIGRRGGIVSNLHGGGESAPLEAVLPSLLTRHTVADVEQACHRLALRIARVIDAACANIGELGIDLALDRDERLWFLEANSRTGRNVFRQIGPHERAQAADVRPLLYAAFLAGFSDESDDPMAER